MPENKDSKAGRDLRKIFSLVPLIHRNQGISLERLRELSGYADRKILRAALDRLMMFGVPPFSPSDFITVYIDEEDRVYLDFPLGLERPLALTPGEWSAVQQVLTEELQFRRAGDPADDRLRDLLARIASIPVEMDPADIFRSKRALVEEAMADSLQLEFRYRTLSSREPEIRRLDPWALFQHNGANYLIGYCHTRTAPRFFHLERMDQIELLDAPQSQPPPENLQELMLRSPIFQNEPAGFSVELAFAPGMRAVLEREFKIFNIAPLGVSMENGEFDGWLRAACKVPESLWFRANLRGLGANVVILSPDHLRESFLQELDEFEMPGEL